jgi:hypothetical protein
LKDNYQGYVNPLGMKSMHQEKNDFNLKIEWRGKEEWLTDNLQAFCKPLQKLG